MARILGILGAVAGVLYHAFFDPSRTPATTAWSSWGLELLAIYGGAGFAIGWILGALLGKVGREE